MDVDSGYKYVNKFRSGAQSYMMGNKYFISNVSFELENENGIIISSKGRSIMIHLSIKEV